MIPWLAQSDQGMLVECISNEQGAVWQEWKQTLGGVDGGGQLLCECSGEPSPNVAFMPRLR